MTKTNLPTLIERLQLRVDTPIPLPDPYLLQVWGEPRWRFHELPSGYVCVTYMEGQETMEEWVLSPEEVRSSPAVTVIKNLIEREYQLALQASREVEQPGVPRFSDAMQQVEQLFQHLTRLQQRTILEYLLAVLNETEHQENRNNVE